MISVIGDVHTRFDILNDFMDNYSPEMILACGDFGIWNITNITNGKFRMSYDLIDTTKTKIYFCDGNHEDHYFLKDLVANFGWENPIELKDNVFYCPRGSSLTLDDGRKVLFFGGAYSVDRSVRILGYSWFEEEMISHEEVYRVDGKKYDIVISHTCPRCAVSVVQKMANLPFGDIHDSCCDALQYVLESVKPSHWYFGHWHTSILPFQKNGCVFHAMNQEGRAGFSTKLY